MIDITIPGDKTIEAEFLVLDYNGTLAIDGKLIDGVKTLLQKLSEKISIQVLTADTFGTSASELLEINCSLQIIQSSFQDQQKENHVDKLGQHNVVAIGNGRNDALMVKSAGLGIVLMQTEGTAVQTLLNADIICRHITDALGLLIHPMRMIATLRN